MGHEPAFRMTVILLNKTEAAGVSRRTNGKRLPGNNFKITLFVIPIANITTIYTHHKRFSWPGQVPPVAGAAGKKT